MTHAHFYHHHHHHADPAWFSRDSLLCPLLTPWGAEFTGKRDFRFFEDTYARSGPNYFARTGPAECDLVICPTTWQNDSHNALVQNIAREAKKWRKPAVVFCEADTEAPFPVPDVFVFRGSLKASVRLPNEYPAPAFILDHIDIPQPLANPGPAAKRARPRSWAFAATLTTEANPHLPIQRALKRALYWGRLSRPGRMERFLRRVRHSQRPRAAKGNGRGTRRWASCRVTGISARTSGCASIF